MDDALYIDTGEYEEREAVFGEGDAGKRLDAALSERFPDLSRSRIQTIIENGLVRPIENGLVRSIENGLVRPIENGLAHPTGLANNTRVKPGDRVVIEVCERIPLAAGPEDIEIAVVYEDEDIAVVDKVRGMVVHPAKGNTSGTLVNALLWRYATFRGGCVQGCPQTLGRAEADGHIKQGGGTMPGDDAALSGVAEADGHMKQGGGTMPGDDAALSGVAKADGHMKQGGGTMPGDDAALSGVSVGETLSGVNGTVRPGVVHRIDKNTSGLLVVAKNDAAHTALAGQFAAHSVTRRYVAIVRGGFADDSGTVDAPIGRDPKHRQRQAVLPSGGKRAVTHWRILERLSGRLGVYTLLELSLETGRTHQIRVHMASIGHPVLGDSLYGAARGFAAREGQYLHAGVLGFDHPATGERLIFESPPPPYFADMLHKLRK